MKKIIFLLLIIVSNWGCKKNNPFDNSSRLIGSWSWISSCGGLAYNCSTPESTNQKINLVFTVDSTLNTYVNDTLKASTRFQTFITPASDFPGTADVIKYNSSNQVKFSIIRDTLYLNDFCCDGFNRNYKRIK
jgi:hypothetical protein